MTKTKDMPCVCLTCKNRMEITEKYQNNYEDTFHRIDLDYCSLTGKDLWDHKIIKCTKWRSELY
jgi:hypothetical protein